MVLVSSWIGLTTRERFLEMVVYLQNFDVVHSMTDERIEFAMTPILTDLMGVWNR